MESLIAAIRLVHVAAGPLALFVAPIPMLTAKGGGSHRRWGKVYFWAMAGVAATAIVLAVWKPVVFLALLAVFSFYSAFYGYRAISRKRPQEGQGALPLDWAAAVAMLAASTAMAVLGTVRPSPAWERVGIVPVVFGVFGMVLAGLDFWRFGWPPADRHAWWFAHMRGMLGSRSEEHTSELQSLAYLVCRILLAKKHTAELQLLAHLVCRLLHEKNSTSSTTSCSPRYDRRHSASATSTTRTQSASVSM